MLFLNYISPYKWINEWSSFLWTVCNHTDITCHHRARRNMGTQGQDIFKAWWVLTLELSRSTEVHITPAVVLQQGLGSPFGRRLTVVKLLLSLDTLFGQIPYVQLNRRFKLPVITFCVQHGNFKLSPTKGSLCILDPCLILLSFPKEKSSY